MTDTGNPLHHAPRFHISLPHGYLNDPNGPIEVNGVTHLYFQSRPLVDHEIPVQWGHATSTDLVHWSLHRPALNPVPGGLDSRGCWSGNTVLDDGRIRAYYSGNTGTRYQSVLTAVSDGEGAQFDEPIQVVEDPAMSEGITMFRDPFVWRGPEGWRMVVGAAGPGDIASIRQYASNDGLRWTRAEDLARLERTLFEGHDTGQGWECPQILDVDGRSVALVSAWSHADGPAEVLAFPLDAAPEPRIVDEGDAFYAASVMRDSSHGPIVFGWIREGRNGAWAREAGWSGAISLPRRAWLEGDTLRTEPHPAVEALRIGEPQEAHGVEIGAQVEIAVADPSGRLRLRFGADELVDIDLDEGAGTVTVNRNAASSDPRATRGQISVDGAFDSRSTQPCLRMFVDGSIIELFTSAGRSITTRTYPTTPPPWRIEAPPGAIVWELERTQDPEICQCVPPA